MNEVRSIKNSEFNFQAEKFSFLLIEQSWMEAQYAKLIFLHALPVSQESGA